MLQWLETLAPRGAVASFASPSLRQWAQDHVGEGPTAWAAEVTAAVMVQLADKVVDPTGRTEIAGARGCEECLLTTLVILSIEKVDSVTTPEAALDDARVAARANIPLERLLRIVWACHAAVQERLLETIGASVSSDDLLGEVHRMIAMLAVLIDRYVSDISATYAEERHESESRLLVERRRLVDSVLDGADPADGSERILGIRWNQQHLAAIGWAAGGNRTFHSEDSAHRFAERLARRGAGTWLVVERGDHVEFHWSFPRADQLDLSTIEAERPPRMRLALGSIAAGADGFVSSTTTARLTRRIAVAMHEFRDIVSYADVDLLSLLSADRDQARLFVRRELAGLLGSDAMAHAIRETLRHFLLGGRSRQAASAATHVAATTVAYRVKRAEELLGRSTLARTQETIAALQLVHAFPDLAE